MDQEPRLASEFVHPAIEEPVQIVLRGNQLLAPAVVRTSTGSTRRDARKGRGAHGRRIESESVRCADLELDVEERRLSRYRGVPRAGDDGGSPPLDEAYRRVVVILAE